MSELMVHRSWFEGDCIKIGVHPEIRLIFDSDNCNELMHEMCY